MERTYMTIQELFIHSNLSLLNVVRQIKDDQWDTPMPKGSSMQPTTLRKAVQYHTYDDAWVPDVLAGRTIEETGNTYDWLQTNEAVLQEYETYNQRASAAVLSFRTLDRITHLSYGDYPARDYLQHIVSFRAFRSYDIAKLINIDTAMDGEFVQALLEEFSPVVEAYRQMGVFPPAVRIAADANPQSKLLAMVGRI
jgi:hypothetical protein